LKISESYDTAETADLSFLANAASSFDDDDDGAVVEAADDNGGNGAVDEAKGSSSNNNIVACSDVAAATNCNSFDYDESVEVLECAICMSPMQVDDIVSWSSNAEAKCCHVFHHECIKVSAARMSKDALKRKIVFYFPDPILSLCLGFFPNSTGMAAPARELSELQERVLAGRRGSPAERGRDGNAAAASKTEQGTAPGARCGPDGAVLSHVRMRTGRTDYPAGAAAFAAATRIRFGRTWRKNCL